MVSWTVARIEAILRGQGKRNANIITGETEARADGLNDKPWIISVSGIRRFVVPGGKVNEITLQATIDKGAVLQFDLPQPRPAPSAAPGAGQSARLYDAPRQRLLPPRLPVRRCRLAVLALGLTSDIRGGRIAVVAESALPLPKGGWLGRMELSDFSILQAPVMVQLLSVASLTDWSWRRAAACSSSASTATSPRQQRALPR